MRRGKATSTLERPAQRPGVRRRRLTTAAQPAVRRPRVLIVEDSDAIRRVLQLLLTSEGFEVTENGDGVDVVEQVRRSRPDVITLDLRLPRADGLEILRQLRRTEAVAQTPIVILSAFADTLSREERTEADDVIIKPFDLDELLARLHRVIERSRAGDRQVN